MSTKITITVESDKGADVRDPTLTINLRADIVLKLEAQTFTLPDGLIYHQLMLMLTDIKSIVEQAEIHVSNLTDLGIIHYSREAPDSDDDIILRAENDDAFWTSAKEIKLIWKAIVAEIRRYELCRLEPPLVEKKRRVHLAITGMGYFNRFISDNICSLPDTYHSMSDNVQRMPRNALSDPTDTLPPPNLFEE